MSKLSQYLGYSGIAPGTHVVSYDDLGDGWLRCGELIPYQAGHKAVIDAAPSLRVLGSAETSVNAGVVGERNKYTPPVWYTHVDGVWVALAAGEMARYSRDLRQWNDTAFYTPDVTQWNNMYFFSRHAASNHVAVACVGGGGSIVVLKGQTAVYPQNANSLNALAIAASSSGWIIVSGFNRSEASVSSTSNPEAGWWAVNTPNFGMPVCSAATWGNAGFVYVGASPAGGKIVTSIVAHNGWEDITNRVPFSLGKRVVDVVYNGSMYFFQTNNRIFTSRDLHTFTPVLTPIGENLEHVYMSVGGTTVALAYNDGVSRFITYTNDDGATWKVLQPYLQVTGVSPALGCCSVSYAGGRWIANFTGVIEGLVDLGPSLDAAPQWVGSQFSPGPGWLVRV